MVNSQEEVSGGDIDRGGIRNLEKQYRVITIITKIIIILLGISITSINDDW